MAFELYRWTFPAIAASPINAGQVVQLTVATSGTNPVDRNVIPLGSTNQEPFGVALATCSNYGATPPFTQSCPVVDRGNTIKVTAIASLGAGADVGIGTNVAGQASGWAAPVVAASGSDVWRVGKATGPAAAGEVFGLYVDPRPLSNAIPA